uniref:Pentraxin (PTX) domain-containing protein n=1 Tax=Gasterosteus aculeatus aculeatus TaxID=481459 RepID=A0AAQ4QGV6_GASAC|nr:C-reactive protein-like isoform X2 [Gasterosteus aculeatus aculeatus]
MRKETQRHSDRNEEAVIVYISQSCSRCAKHPDTDFTMTFLLLLVMLTACAAIPQDLSGKMFTFPQQSATSLVKLTASELLYRAVTVCHRSFTDLKRDHALFSLAAPSNANEFLIFWDETKKGLEPHVKNAMTEYRGLDYKLNMWHSICTTWDSESGLVQMWFDGQPTIRKFITSGSAITGSNIIILGQEQDSYGGGYYLTQSFVGMMSDVHMWDHTLSPCEIHKYVDGLNFTPGNVLNWGALEFQITGKVIVEDKLNACY